MALPHPPPHVPHTSRPICPIYHRHHLLQGTSGISASKESATHRRAPPPKPPPTLTPTLTPTPASISTGSHTSCIAATSAGILIGSSRGTLSAVDWSGGRLASITIPMSGGGGGRREGAAAGQAELAPLESASRERVSPALEIGEPSCSTRGARPRPGLPVRRCNSSAVAAYLCSATRAGDMSAGAVSAGKHSYGAERGGGVALGGRAVGFSAVSTPSPPASAVCSDSSHRGTPAIAIGAAPPVANPPVRELCASEALGVVASVVGERAVVHPLYAVLERECSLAQMALEAAGGWELEPSGARCVAIGHTLKRVAVGTHDGTVGIFAICHLGGGGPARIATLTLAPWGLSRELSGATRCVSYANDGETLAVGWAERGLALYSGAHAMCTSFASLRRAGATGAAVRCGAEGVAALAWNQEDSSLLVLAPSPRTETVREPRETDPARTANADALWSLKLLRAAAAARCCPVGGGRGGGGGAL